MFVAADGENDGGGDGAELCDLFDGIGFMFAFSLFLSLSLSLNFY